MDHLIEINLFPVIEFMGNLLPISYKNQTEMTFSIRKMWFELTDQLIKHYTRRYGTTNVEQWKFELWNEPDLHTYNILNFTFDGKKIK